jgi:hypothetical protein
MQKKTKIGRNVKNILRQKKFGNRRFKERERSTVLPYPELLFEGILGIRIRNHS